MASYTSNLTRKTHNFHMPVVSTPMKNFIFCVSYILQFVAYSYGTAVAQWLRCCATNQKVAGSIPDGVIGIFH